MSIPPRAPPTASRTRKKKPGPEELTETPEPEPELEETELTLAAEAISSPSPVTPQVAVPSRILRLRPHDIRIPEFTGKMNAWSRWKRMAESHVSSAGCKHVLDGTSPEEITKEEWTHSQAVVYAALISSVDGVAHGRVAACSNQTDCGSKAWQALLKRRGLHRSADRLDPPA